MIAETRCGVQAERAALAGLEGGCQASIGAWGRVEGGKLALDVFVLSSDGAQRLIEQGVGEPAAGGRDGPEYRAETSGPRGRDTAGAEGPRDSELSRPDGRQVCNFLEAS